MWAKLLTIYQTDFVETRKGPAKDTGQIVSVLYPLLIRNGSEQNGTDGVTNGVQTAVNGLKLVETPLRPFLKGVAKCRL